MLPLFFYVTNDEVLSVKRYKEVMFMDMELNLNLALDQKDNSSRVKEAVKKKADAKYVPTWEEVWTTGFTSHTGKEKKAILQTKISDTDRKRLLEVKHAVETGELGTNVEDLRKFSKSHALGLFKILNESRKERYIAEMIAHKPDNYILVDNEEEFFDMIAYIEMNEETKIGLDTETTGVEHQDRIVGISMTLPKTDLHYYIPVRHNVPDYQIPADLVFESLKPVLEDESIGKVLHNAKFDFHMFAKEGIQVKGLHMDTMIAMAVLNETEESYALKKLATKYGRYFGFEEESHTYEDLFGKGGFQDTPLDIGHIYACKDTHLVIEFGNWIEEQLKKQPNLWSQYFDLENKVFDVAYEMEKNGFLIDMEFAKTYEAKLEQQVADLEGQLNKYFPGINVASNQQLADYLYNTLGLDDNNNGSVDADTLKELRDDYKGIAVLLEHRELVKLLSTYIKPLPEKVWEDGRLHGQFNQTATVTGRFASRNPNLQNLPPDARKLIIAPKGYILVGIDLSAIEPRILSHMAKDQEMQRAYREGKDLYSFLASKIFKVPIEQCGDGTKYRKKMKVGLLAVMYGVSTRSLAEQLDIPVEEADQFMADFMTEFPDIKAFIEQTHKEAFDQGYVEMLWGRKRRFHNDLKQYRAKVSSKNWADKKEARRLFGRINRQSVNSKIQGSASIVLKKGMIACYEMCKEKGWQFVASVHDENLFYIPETVNPEEIEALGRCMTGCVTLDVPLKCDIEVSLRWGEGVPFKTWVEQRNVA